MKLTFKIPTDFTILDEPKAGSAMAEAVRDLVRRHFTNRSLHAAPSRFGIPPSGFWHKAAGTVKVASHRGLKAVISAGAESNDPRAPGQGVALHYYGGTVYPKKKALAIPIDPSVAGIWPSEAGALANEGEYSIFWPKNSSHGFIKDNERGELLWLLIPKATIHADPTVLPTDEQLSEVAMSAIWEIAS